MWTRKWLWAIVALGVLASFPVAWSRHRAEMAARQVELVMDYGELREVSLRSGTVVSKDLENLKAQGLVSVAIEEETLGSLEARGELLLIAGGKAICDAWQRRAGSPALDWTVSQPWFDPSGTLIMPLSPTARFMVSSRLPVRLKNHLVHEFSIDLGMIGYFIPLDYRRASELNMGFNPETEALIRRLGLDIVYRPSNFRGITRDWIELVVPEGKGIIVSSGTEVLGYPSQLGAAAETMRSRESAYGDIEFAAQSGATELARLMGNHVVRVHSITRPEMDRRMTLDSAVDRMARAAFERGIRLLYLRPFTDAKGDVGTDELNRAYVGRLRSRLQGMGFEIGRASLPSSVDLGIFMRTLLVLGISAGALLLIGHFVSLKLSTAIGVLVLPVAAHLMLHTAGQWVLASQVAAFGASVIFPSLSATAFLTIPSRGHWLADAAIRFMAASALSVAGGLLLAASLSQTAFMMKTEQFIGVKAMHVFPILIGLAACWHLSIRDGSESVLSGIKRIANSPILVWQAGVIGGLGIIGLVYLLRTGNTLVVPVPDLEQIMRAFLEKVFTVRPRTKEFLIGHPALMLSGLLLMRSVRVWLIPVFILGLMGQVSIVNTFAHMHTPVSVTLTRVMLGLGLGLGLGVFTAALFSSAMDLLRKRVSAAK